MSGQLVLDLGPTTHILQLQLVILVISPRGLLFLPYPKWSHHCHLLGQSPPGALKRPWGGNWLNWLGLGHIRMQTCSEEVTFMSASHTQHLTPCCSSLPTTTQGLIEIMTFGTHPFLETSDTLNPGGGAYELCH